MAIDGPVPVPGHEFGVYFDEDNVRGGAFVLQPWTGEAWADPVYLLTADTNGDRPTATRATDNNYGWDDWGNANTGPDGLILPADITAGHWRLCTANALEQACVQLEVGSADRAIEVDPDTSPPFGPLARSDSIVIGAPYRATVAELDGANVEVRHDDEIVITFTRADRLVVTNDGCSWGGAKFQFEDGKLVTAEWESTAEGCNRSTREVRRLLLDLFEDQPVVRTSETTIQMTTKRTLIQLEADTDPN